MTMSESKIPLNLHRTLRADHCRRPVEMILKVDSLLRNLPQLGKGENLKTPAVCKYRSVPAHEFVQTALSGDHLLAGSNVKMIGISKNDLGTELLELDR